MIFVLTFVVFVTIAAVGSLVGARLYSRPKAAVERITGATAAETFTDYTPVHPALLMRELIQKAGSVLPASPKDVTVMQRRLIRAGIRSEHALKVFYGAKVVLGVTLPLIMSLVVAGSPAESTNKMLAIGAAALAGFFGPNEYVKILGQRRQKQIQRALPNALDLLVVSVESGLGLDQAILQVAKELEHAHKEITEEFALVNYEMKAGKRRVEALRNLGERTAVEDLRKLVAVLIQADRFGTGVAQALRAHADYMRVQARQIAEEKAAKLGVKLVFPIFFCILPSLFVVTVGPMIVRIVREFLPMVQAM